MLGSGQANRIAVKEIVYLSLSDLDLKLQVKLQQLKLQFYFCFIGIVLTVIAFASVDRSECCALPFVESACGHRDIFAHFATNQSTLYGEVDEFLTTIQTKISHLHDAIEFPSLTDRQKTLEVTKDELWDLIQDHSANLAAFGAIKREDERMEEFKVAVAHGWFLLVPFLFFGALYNGIIGIALQSTTMPDLRHLAILGTLSEDEIENLQNSRITKLKRRIPIFYLATLICILIELGLYLTFMAGQYYTGSCATYIFIAQTKSDIVTGRLTYLPKSFTNYTTFANELQSTLDVHIKNLNTTMQYSALASRQLGWYSEYEAIKPALTHYTELKKYHVNRNTMPRHIRGATPRGVTSAMQELKEDIGQANRIALEEIIYRPLRDLELKLQQLKLLFYFCFIGIVLTVIAFLYNREECCALPFEESACGPRDVFAHFATNQSTLYGKVDEFLAIAQSKIFNLHDAIEFPSLTDRQKTFEVTKDELWQLFAQHSANLAAFGAIKRENERRKEFEEAVLNGWSLLMIFVFFGGLYNGLIGIKLKFTIRPNLRHLDVLRRLSKDERENLQNSRMRKLKRQIPIFYLATLICILVEVGLYVTFMAGQYYTGSCATYKNRQTYLAKSFTNYTNYTDELQSTLEVHIKKLNTTMQYSALETRQLGWYYEYEAIKPALAHYNGLKKYHVDRNTMPRHIRGATPRTVTCVVSGICLFFNFVFLANWANQEGSVWHPQQFMEYF
ncbi:hypothetical protein Ddc_10206 [Ditylenchus destructor]|nr:hypothetical protein Ddc_10206 [Ditylenchus destructor]